MTPTIEMILRAFEALIDGTANRNDLDPLQAHIMQIFAAHKEGMIATEMVEAVLVRDARRAALQLSKGGRLTGVVDTYDMARVAAVGTGCMIELFVFFNDLPRAEVKALRDLVTRAREAANGQS